MIKLIALDLDGTLTSADHMTVTQKTRDALKRAHDAGDQNHGLFLLTEDVGKSQSCRV